MQNTCLYNEIWFKKNVDLKINDTHFFILTINVICQSWLILLCSWKQKINPTIQMMSVPHMIHEQYWSFKKYAYLNDGQNIFVNGPCACFGEKISLNMGIELYLIFYQLGRMTIDSTLIFFYLTYVLSTVYICLLTGQ